MVLVVSEQPGDCEGAAGFLGDCCEGSAGFCLPITNFDPEPPACTLANNRPDNRSASASSILGLNIFKKLSMKLDWKAKTKMNTATESTW